MGLCRQQERDGPALHLHTIAMSVWSICRDVRQCTLREQHPPTVPSDMRRLSGTDAIVDSTARTYSRTDARANACTDACTDANSDSHTAAHTNANADAHNDANAATKHADTAGRRVLGVEGPAADHSWPDEVHRIVPGIRAEWHVQRARGESFLPRQLWGVRCAWL